MSPEMKMESELGRHELAVRYLTQSYEQPLLKGLWDRWAYQKLPDGSQRGWFVCGPGSIALSRLINWKTGIPILKDGDRYHQEHLQLSPTKLYIPPNGRVEDIADHVYLSYFNGKGQVVHIDVTWPLTWGDKKHLKGKQEIDLSGAILMKKYQVKEYEKKLESDFSLYPLNPKSQIVKDLYKGFKEHLSDPDDPNNLFNRKHTDSITVENPFTNGDDRYGLPLADFIRRFIPEWTGIRR